MESRNTQSKAARKPSRDAGKARPQPTSEPRPRVMTEDEADILYSEKHKGEEGIPLEKALKELGISEAEVGR